MPGKMNSVSVKKKRSTKKKHSQKAVICIVSTGETLACQDYRAWDKGEPSHSRGCVVLSRLNVKVNPVWKVVSCSMQLPYICELPRLSDRPYLNRTKS